MSEGNSTTIETVEYRDIPGWPFYRVGNNGSPWSRNPIKKSVMAMRPLPEWRPLKPEIQQGYLKVTLFRNGKGKHFMVHDLVLRSFVGAPEPRQEALHKDGVRSNNRLENLRWGTSLENALDSIRHGTKPCKLLPSQVQEIRRLRKEGMMLHKIGEVFSVSKITVFDIVKGRTWKHLDVS